MKITKDQLFRQIKGSLLGEDNRVECSFELLKFAFGFKRVDGETFMLTKLLKPSVTEESMSYIPKDEIIQNVKDWANENEFGCYYNGYVSMNDTFTFYVIPKDYAR